MLVTDWWVQSSTGHKERLYCESEGKKDKKVLRVGSMYN
jgi:hypothetical protein